MIVTLDTNVLLAALLSQRGASHHILRLVLEEKLRTALSTPVLLEYADVLSRQEIQKLLHLSSDEVEDVLDVLALLAEKHAVLYRLRPNLLDEKDNLFMECAFASRSSYLITSNIKDFSSGELKGHPFSVMTPGDFYSFWRRSNE